MILRTTPSKPFLVITVASTVWWQMAGMVSDFGAPWPKGRLPADLDPSELIVGFLDRERAGGVEWNAAEFNEGVAKYYAQHRLAGTCLVTDEQLKQIRAALREVIARWEALPAGETLELPFERSSFSLIHG